MFVNLQKLAQDFFKQGKNILLEQINNVKLNSFNRHKSILLQKVKSHPISVELSSHTSPSSFLKGTNGSLFGFIGFQANSNPVEDLMDFLEDNIKFLPATTMSLQGVTSFGATIPSMSDFKFLFPLFWEPDRSWVYSIEDGISGLGYYINNKYGRSKEGIQVQSVVNKSEFVPVPFLTPIFKEFKERMSRND